jgi:hypothetical protein
MVSLTACSFSGDDPSSTVARVNLARRAEIGAEKRERTRAAILDAARDCCAEAQEGSVTINALMQAAGLAKGTFDEELQPARLVVSDPLTRLATETTILLRHLVAQPARARLTARVAANIPDVSRAVRARFARGPCFLAGSRASHAGLGRSRARIASAMSCRRREMSV